MIDLKGTPYLLSDPGIFDRQRELYERVEMLRAQGTLTDATLRAHFGNTRFEQIAESNGIEGSTLSVNETQLAVLQGIAISGHDPAFARDARNLASALERVVELARSDEPLDIPRLNEIHSLILGNSAGSGLFRNEPIRISGADHRPPKTWKEVMAAMEDWERWSMSNPSVPPVLRATVLHTWLTHIHPYLDGNGRTARAIMNLELIRSGYPALIVRRKDRVRYYEGLAESDAGGDLSSIAELIVQRAEDALLALERAAKVGQDYDLLRARIAAQNTERVEIWNSAVRLLHTLIQQGLTDAFQGVASTIVKWYDGSLNVDDYLAMTEGNSAGNSWAFSIEVRTIAGQSVSYLAWIGYRSSRLRDDFEGRGGPSVFWSKRAESGPYRWVRTTAEAPGAAELTLEVPNVDRWTVRDSAGRVERLLPTEIASRIVLDVGRRLSDS
ncbi:Fic family protein [Nocardioides sp. CN2-186]|uniref:Fic family protein n=1 Tax=Nocardioides tweenelious TaxID=3156607 RepID=UPI0032B58F73